MDHDERIQLGKIKRTVKAIYVFTEDQILKHGLTHRGGTFTEKDLQKYNPTGFILMFFDRKGHDNTSIMGEFDCSIAVQKLEEVIVDLKKMKPGEINDSY